MSPVVVDREAAATAVLRPAGGEGPRPIPPPGMSRRGDWLTALLSAWLIAGVFLDAWAHTTQPSLETFFTPWHAVLYSGFLATAGWILGVAWRVPRGPGGRRAMPAGYGLAVFGVLVFAVSGLGDMAWHVVFGIERNVAALLSPTHLGLYVAMLLIVTAPARSAWARAGERPGAWGPLLPAALSLALAGTLTALILQPYHPIASNFASRRLAALIEARSGGSPFVMARNVQTGLAGFIFATLTLFGPVLLLLRRWRPPAGLLAGMIALQCVAMQGTGGFRDPALAAFGALGAVAVEGLVRGLRPDAGDRWRMVAFAGLAPPLFWGVYLAGVAARDGGLGWAVEIWSGALVWSGLALLGLALAMSLGPRPADVAG